MRVSLLLFPLLVAACATPQERCIGNSSRDLRVITALIGETRGNLSRGFAIEERSEVVTERSTCSGRNEDGSRFLFRCDEAKTITKREAVAIDLNAERAKLASLEERQLQLQSNQQAVIAQCQAQFPAS